MDEVGYMLKCMKLNGSQRRGREMLIVYHLLENGGS